MFGVKVVAEFRIMKLDPETYAGLIDQIKKMGWVWYRDFLFEPEKDAIKVYVFKDNTQELKECLVDYLI